MNIFFIGPYRQNNFDGIFSRNIISSIARKHNIFTRPIYYEKSNLADIDSSVEEYENKDLVDYDYLVQNVRPSDCLHTTQFGKNILIPIIDQNRDEEILVDQTITKILSDSYDSEGLDKAELFDYDIFIEQEKGKIFEVGPLQSMKKFYFIGEYSKNYDVILSCIRSFIYIRSKIDANYILVLFLVNPSQPDLAFINNYIQQTYNLLKSPHTISRVIVSPIGMSLENISTAHNTGDVFLNFNTYPKNQINAKIAKKFNKHIIDKPIGTYTLLVNTSIVSTFTNTISDKEITDSFINYLIEEKLNKYTYSSNRGGQHIADIL